MDTSRRDFLKKAMLLSGAAGWSGLIPESISRALALDPAPGSTYLDAEHVVILMQENRSFDHCFGTLQGVRGFNDPRRINLPDGNPVWLQSTAKGETSVPFRFDIHGTKATWMGSTPHSRASQVDAWNDGKYDQWLVAKQVGNKSYAHMPLTMGYYTRADVPFNYALADAFTVCDQNFCSAMTSTWPNRLYLWSGTIRGEQHADAKAYIRNDIPWGEAHWTTFPELLEKQNIPWRIYQNDITTGGGFTGEERAWLSNFGCNPMEWFTQFNVRFNRRYVQSLQKQIAELPPQIEALRQKAGTDAGKSAKLAKDIAAKEKVLASAHKELKEWSQENYDKLPARDKSLHERAFTSNSTDPDCLQLERMSYEDKGEKREIDVPKGDILKQFRDDVKDGKLPAVSWLIGPSKFSDHPSSPWFGSWYVSEVLDILTKNPDVWKKTIFILTYDENDGYFDHVPPYVAPDPKRPETGRCSEGIDSGVEYITLANELRDGVPEKDARQGPAGLGFRVPMIVASPWSRGGRVCSHVFDHTSVFRFVQDFINEKKGAQVLKEATTSEWRKTVSGHLGMVFRPHQGGDGPGLVPLERQAFVQGIYNARFKDAPANYKVLTPGEIGQCRKDSSTVDWMPRQEPGTRPSCALPYQLYAEGSLAADRSQFVVKLEARNEIFGAKASGSPFNVFLPGKYAVAREKGQPPVFEHVGYRSYAVRAGDALTESFPLASFEGGRYHLAVHGPNGFLREHQGDAQDPALLIECEYDREAPGSTRLNVKLRLSFNQSGNKALSLEIKDNAYGKGSVRKELPAGGGKEPLVVVLDQADSHGWYDFTLTVSGFETFSRRYAGRIETGRDCFTDPVMGGPV